MQRTISIRFSSINLVFAYLKNERLQYSLPLLSIPEGIFGDYNIRTHLKT